MNKVYIMTSGEYSDYHIDAVFSDKELANKIATEQGCMIEEWNIDDPKWQELSKLAETHKGYEIRIFTTRSRGEELFVRVVNLSSYFMENPTHFTDWTFKKDWDNMWEFMANVAAKDEEHAKKIATERFQKFIAERAMEGKPIERMPAK